MSVRTREEVLTLVRDHLAEELQTRRRRRSASRAASRRTSTPPTRSILYELVMELEDTYGVSVSERAGVSQDRDRRRRRRLRARPRSGLGQVAADPRVDDRGSPSLIDELPDDLRRWQAPTHSSWSERREPTPYDAPGLSSATACLPWPSLPICTRAWSSAFGALRRRAAWTKIHNQAVSGVACAEVGRELGVPEMLRTNEPEDMPVGIPAEVLLDGERPLLEATEALIGACYLALPASSGPPRRWRRPSSRRSSASAARTPDRFFKSALQELLARRGAEVTYEVTAEDGPPHARTLHGHGAVVDDRAPLRQRQRTQQEARRAGRRPAGERRAAASAERSRCEEPTPCA